MTKLNNSEKIGRLLHVMLLAFLAAFLATLTTFLVLPAYLNGQNVTQNAAGTFKDGVAALQRRDYTTALSLLRTLAAQDNVWIIFFLWLILAALVGVVAGLRGRNGGIWFVLAVYVSPLIAGLLVLALPRIEGQIQPEDDGKLRWLRIAAGVAAALFIIIVATFFLMVGR